MRANWNKRAQEIFESSDLDARIVQLAKEAHEAGDTAQEETCETALGLGSLATSDRAIREAREACAWTLAQAETAA